MIDPDKKIKALLKGSFDTPTPSPDFTHTIMDKIAAQEPLIASPKFEYVPVISKTGWMLIVVGFISLVFLALSGSKESTFNVSNHIPNWHLDVSIAHFQLVLMAVLSIFALLLIDRLLVKLKFH